MLAAAKNANEAEHARYGRSSPPSPPRTRRRTGRDRRIASTLHRSRAGCGRHPRRGAAHGIGSLVVREEAIDSEPLGHIEHSVDRLAPMIGERRMGNERIDPQPVAEQEVEIAGER